MSFVFPWIMVASFVVTPTVGREWLKDYGEALEATKEAGRPLLIVIDRQPKWLAHVEPASDSGQPVASSLLRKFTLCHVDATTPYGQAVARAFRTSTLPATVIIDKTGSVQLAKRTGRLSAQTLSSLLVAHQQGGRPAPVLQPFPAQPFGCRT